jgi:hypothetical protein
MEGKMTYCPKEEKCAFTHCDDQFKILASMSYYEKEFCHGSSQERCVRIKLENKFGKIHVPSNMMPNGLPLPGTHRRDWTSYAINYKRFVENKDG